MKQKTTLIAFTFSTECFSSRCHEVAWHGTARELEARLRICAAQDAGAENPLCFPVPVFVRPLARTPFPVPPTPVCPSFASPFPVPVPPVRRHCTCY